MENVTDWTVSKEKILRPALGHEVGYIGELYNAKAEEFCHLSLFSSSFPDRFIKPIENKHTDVDYSSEDTISKKYSLLKLEAQLKLSTLLTPQDVKFEGHASILNKQKVSERNVSCTLSCYMSTISEKLHGPFEEMREYIQENVFDNDQYTHFVVGINWGANCFVNMEHSDTESNNKTAVEAALTAELKQLGSLIKPEGRGSGGYETSHSDIVKRSDIKVSADVCPDNLLWSKSEVEKFLSEYSQHLKEANNGKGKPISYFLTPISTFKRLYGFREISPTTLISIDDNFINRLIWFFEELALIKQKLNDLKKDYTDFNEYLPSDCESGIVLVERNIRVDETALKTRLSLTVPKVRKGQKKMRDLQDILNEYQSSSLDVQKLKDSIKKLSRQLKSKIDVIKICRSKDIVYLKKEENLTSYMMERKPDDDYFVMHISSEMLSDENMSSLFLFTSQAQEIRQENQHFIVVDLDANGTTQSNRFLHYKKGEILCRDTCKHLSAPRASFWRYFSNFPTVINFANFQMPRSFIRGERSAIGRL